MPPRAYSINQTVKTIGIGRTSLYAAIARGDLKARKMGGRTLIMSDDLQHWLDSLPALKPSKLNHG